MNPQLIVISGEKKGMIFAPDQPVVSVGREPSNVICLNDPSISRRHCLLKLEAHNSKGSSEQPSSSEPFVKLIDLESFNGTFVNGIPIKEHTLTHGDQISLGDVQFLFLTHEADVGANLNLEAPMDEGRLITRSTVRLRREDAFYLHPERVRAGFPERESHVQSADSSLRVAADLNALLKISTAINSTRNLQELQCRLLELVSEVIPTEREAILLIEEGQTLHPDTLLEETHSFPGSICGWSRLAGSDDSIRVSRTITNQVLREGVALLSNDLFENADLGQRPSLVAARVCSVLCVPLILFDKTIGVIYLDTSDPTARFDEGHLQLLTAIAGIAAIAFENVRHVELVEGENQRLQNEIQLEHKMIGESAAMREIYRLLAKVAATDSTVLLRGESGTGKELAAHAIHVNSSRSTTPFVAINCATLSETLLESELFGHEKGAFTGAIAQRRGKLEVADGGTVFLDEVGELTPMIQAKLLRVLQEREFERVGGIRSIKVDVRIIAATNKDLEEAIKDGSFRQDLYYRLNVVSIAMPALRERRDDISLLASYFAAKYSKQCKRRVSGISREARAALQSYDWPGNVRELENALERAVVLGSDDRIGLEDLPEALLETGGATLQNRKYYDAIREAKKQIIKNALEESQGNYTQAAKLLGMHANNLHRLIRTLNLRETIKTSEK